MDGMPDNESRSSQESGRDETLLDPGDSSNSNAVTGNDDNKFQKAISAWRNINLTKLIPELDTTASDLVAHQRDALVERKDLAQKTKDFRKLEDPDKLTEIKSLLKAYQTYIDLVTNHSKSISSSFLQVYSSFSEAPDPYPLLEASVESIVVADETVPKLEAENKHLQATTSNLASQLEDIERQLANERSARQELEDSQESKIKDVEASWSAVLSEKQDNWDARERNLEERSDNQERLLKELKASYEVSQRLDRSVDNDPSVSVASAAELELVSSELERANQRLADVEARNEQLRLELAQSASQGGTQKRTTVEEDPSFLRLRSENSSLLRKVDAAKFERESEKRELETTVRGLKKEVSALKEDSDSLKMKVQKWSDYEDVKRELEVIKSIEFSTGYNDDASDLDQLAREGKRNGASSDQTQNLEQLLLARNKKLNNELTVLRVSHQDLAGRLETLQGDLSETNMELEKSRNLTATLENDLSRIQSEAPSVYAPMSVAGTFQSKYTSGLSVARKGRTSPTSSIISGFEQPGQGTTLDALRAGEPVGGGSGILPMVAAQRDRFKKKNSELENELSKSQQTVSTLRAEVASLQKDNLNLYEKTRYVSTYSRTQPPQSASAFATNSNSTSIQVDHSAPLDRYRSAYESRISPFAVFRGRESARAFKRMSLPERAIYQITRMVLATRASRNLFALYCLALHLMVFGMLYYTSTIEIEKHVTHFATGAAQLAGGAAADAAGAGEGANAWHQEEFHDAAPG